MEDGRQSKAAGEAEAVPVQVTQNNAQHCKELNRAERSSDSFPVPVGSAGLS